MLEGTTLGARDDFGLGRGSPDVFYRFSLQRPSDLVLFLATQPGWDAQLYLLAGTCAEHRIVAHNDDFGGQWGESRIEQLDLVPGDYIVVVTGFSERNSGAFALTGSFALAPECGDGECQDRETVFSCPGDCVQGAECGDGLCTPGEDPQVCPADCVVEASCACDDAQPIAGLGLQRVQGDLEPCAPPILPGADVEGAAWVALSVEREVSLTLELQPPQGWDLSLLVLDQDQPCAQARPLQNACGPNDEPPCQLRRDVLRPGRYLLRVRGACAPGACGFTLDARFDEPVRCGDGVCSVGWESSDSCHEDCRNVCGDGACDWDEDFATCPADCPGCGDGICQGDEDARSCPVDCEGVPAPPNDHCEAAEIIEPGPETLLVEGTTISAERDLGLICGIGPNRARDVFYLFHLDHPATVLVALTATEAWDPFLYLLGQTCGAQAEVITCNDDEGGMRFSRMEANLEPGDYWIMVAGYGAHSSGPFEMEVTATPCPEGGCGG